MSLGLVVLVDSFPERILKRLLQDFHPGGSLPTSNKDHSLETRLKVGEVLMRASRAIGEHHLYMFVCHCRFRFHGSISASLILIALSLVPTKKFKMIRLYIVMAAP